MTVFIELIGIILFIIFKLINYIANFIYKLITLI